MKANTVGTFCSIDQVDTQKPIDDCLRTGTPVLEKKLAPECWSSGTTLLSVYAYTDYLESRLPE